MDPLPANWRPWRTPSPLDGRRPSREELARAVHEEWVRDDVLPYPSVQASAGWVRLLIVGINPSPWTAATNAPFSRPGNRFWPSLYRAGLTPHEVDASRGLSADDERMLAERGIAITNVVNRATARADELSRAELRAGGEALLDRVRALHPERVAVVGVTAFREAFTLPRTRLGEQHGEARPAGWPEASRLVVLPNPSGLNAHETLDSLADKWRTAWGDGPR